MILLGKRYLVFYAIVSIFLFLLLSPFLNIKMNKLLANLTEQLILKEINPVRESHGFLDLEVNEKLAKAAQMKVLDMVERNYFDHIGPNGETPWTWLDLVDYDYAAAGENLAINACDPLILMNAWLNSPSHAKNILNGYFTDIGIGIADGEIDGKKTTVVVMFVGREKTANLELASNMSDDYKDIIIAQVEKSSKPQSIYNEDINVGPEKPVVIRTVPEEDLYKENLIIAALDRNSIRETNTDVAFFQMFLMNDAPKLLRLLLTVLYAGLAILAVLGITIRNKRDTSIVLRSIFLLLLTIFIWLPEVI